MARSGATVTTDLKAKPADDFSISAPMRADGRVLYDLALEQVKTPGESRGGLDYDKPGAVLKAVKAFRGLPDVRCGLLR